MSFRQMTLAVSTSWFRPDSGGTARYLRQVILKTLP